MFDLFNLEQETEQVTKNILNKAKKETIKKVTKQIETESETKQETESETKQEIESEKVKTCMTVKKFIERLKNLIVEEYGEKEIYVGYSEQWKKIYKISRDSNNKNYSSKVIIDTLPINNDYETFTVRDIYNCMIESNFNENFLVVTDTNNKVIDIDIDIDDSVTIGIEE